MLCIRLQRIGKPKQPVYRLIVSEKHRDTHYPSLESLGEYNPIRKEKIFNVKVDRIKYWLSVGAQPSDTLHNLFLKEGIIEGKKAGAVRISARRRVKLDAKKAAEQEKIAAAAAKVAAAAAPAEAPAEETAPAA